MNRLSMNLELVGINIGTRPDCLPDETIEYLADLSERMHVTVELGFTNNL